MNRIQFTIDPHPAPSPEYRKVEILVDGARLIDLLRTIELPWAEREGSPNIAGAYAGLSAGTTFFPSRHFLGRTRPLLERDGKIVILICPCGCEGCWDFVCRITVSGCTVTWSEFEQVHRDWIYSALGTLVFDRQEYENELGFPLIWPRGSAGSTGDDDA